MTRHEEIQSSYKTLGKVGIMYDGIVTRSTLLGKLMDSLIWGLNRDLAAKWINDALAPIPADFSGRLLEIKTPRLIQINDLPVAYPQAG